MAAEPVHGTTGGVVAARGTGLRCRSWRAEALLRMLENVREVGERPQDLVVYAAATVFTEIAERGRQLPAIVTDQTAAHEARYGYVPEGMDLAQWRARRETEPDEVARQARAGMARQAVAMLRPADHGAVVSENSNNLRVQAASVLDASQAKAVLTIPGFMESYPWTDVKHEEQG
ncbi:hypothetical protein [Amycolatopsis taiwanensis]|uniref:Urocanase Rossmann-like domain-containing protein n=1 Tax=Amycolatopsis taiwanensis TaxID=342230 RepID=A0A9W6R480_9PSEU|nr:hypothetical protein [Amycolatopsis taiwanensis]GLY68055.1 hypothetical protein Atai01_46740 [Amycolatopsis taiwanensis]